MRLFSPEHETAESAKESLLHILHREPMQFGVNRSRWSLSSLLGECNWLRVTTEGGLSTLLKRLGIHYKRGRDYVRSPDADYTAKVEQIEHLKLRAWYAPEQYVLLYQDEMTYYRQPTLSYAYEAAGAEQPLAFRSHRSNTSFRITATLNAVTGQVHYRQRSRIDRFQLVHFFADVVQAYPTVETIYIVLDNWPVHFHPDVLAALEPQRHLRWSSHFPPNWPAATTRTPAFTNLPIQLVPLPTYASWLNPIEKLWRWLRQDLLHLHRFSNRWDALKQRVSLWLDTFSSPSNPLLRYVGLLPN